MLGTYRRSCGADERFKTTHGKLECRPIRNLYAGTRYYFLKIAQREKTPENARLLAEHLRNYIIQLSSRNKCVDGRVVKLAHRKILYVHSYCCQVAEVTNEYILDHYMMDALVSYVTLELNVLRDPKYNQDKEYKFSLQDRVTRLLWTIYSKYYLCLTGRADRIDIWEMILRVLLFVPPDVPKFFNDILDHVKKILPAEPRQPLLPCYTERFEASKIGCDSPDALYAECKSQGIKFDLTSTRLRKERGKPPQRFTKEKHTEEGELTEDLLSWFKTIQNWKPDVRNRPGKLITRTNLRPNTLICLSDDDDEEEKEVRRNKSRLEIYRPEVIIDLTQEEEPPRDGCIISTKPLEIREADQYSELLDQARLLLSKFQQLTGTTAVSIFERNGLIEVDTTQRMTSIESDQIPGIIEAPNPLEERPVTYCQQSSVIENVQASNFLSCDSKPQNDELEQVPEPLEAVSSRKVTVQLIEESSLVESAKNSVGTEKEVGSLEENVIHTKNTSECYPLDEDSKVIQSTDLTKRVTYSSENDLRQASVAIQADVEELHTSEIKSRTAKGISFDGACDEQVSNSSLRVSQSACTKDDLFTSVIGPDSPGASSSGMSEKVISNIPIIEEKKAPEQCDSQPRLEHKSALEQSSQLLPSSQDSSVKESEVTNVTKPVLWQPHILISSKDIPVKEPTNKDNSPITIEDAATHLSEPCKDSLQIDSSSLEDHPTDVLDQPEHVKYHSAKELIGDNLYYYDSNSYKMANSFPPRMLPSLEYHPAKEPSVEDLSCQVNSHVTAEVTNSSANISGQSPQVLSLEEPVGIRPQVENAMQQSSDVSNEDILTRDMTQHESRDSQPTIYSQYIKEKNDEETRISKNSTPVDEEALLEEPEEYHGPYKEIDEDLLLGRESGRTSEQHSPQATCDTVNNVSDSAANCQDPTEIETAETDSELAENKTEIIEESSVTDTDKEEELSTVSKNPPNINIISNMVIRPGNSTVTKNKNFSNQGVGDLKSPKNVDSFEWCPVEDVVEKTMEDDTSSQSDEPVVTHEDPLSVPIKSAFAYHSEPSASQQRRVEPRESLPSTSRPTTEHFRPIGRDGEVPTYPPGYKGKKKAKINRGDSDRTRSGPRKDTENIRCHSPDETEPLDRLVSQLIKESSQCSTGNRSETQGDELIRMPFSELIEQIDQATGVKVSRILANPDQLIGWDHSNVNRVMGEVLTTIDPLNLTTVQVNINTYSGDKSSDDCDQTFSREYQIGQEPVPQSPVEPTNVPSSYMQGYHSCPDNKLMTLAGVALQYGNSEATDSSDSELKLKIDENCSSPETPEKWKEPQEEALVATTSPKRRKSGNRSVTKRHKTKAELKKFPAKGKSNGFNSEDDVPLADRIKKGKPGRKPGSKSSGNKSGRKAKKPKIPEIPYTSKLRSRSHSASEKETAKEEIIIPTPKPKPRRASTNSKENSKAPKTPKQALENVTPKERETTPIRKPLPVFEEVSPASSSSSSGQPPYKPVPPLTFKVPEVHTPTKHTLATSPPKKRYLLLEKKNPYLEETTKRLEERQKAKDTAFAQKSEDLKKQYLDSIIDDIVENFNATAKELSKQQSQHNNSSMYSEIPVVPQDIVADYISSEAAISIPAENVSMEGEYPPNEVLETAVASEATSVANTSMKNSSGEDSLLDDLPLSQLRESVLSDQPADNLEPAAVNSVDEDNIKKDSMADVSSEIVGCEVSVNKTVDTGEFDEFLHPCDPEQMADLSQAISQCAISIPEEQIRYEEDRNAVIKIEEKTEKKSPSTDADVAERAAIPRSETLLFHTPDFSENNSVVPENSKEVSVGKSTIESVVCESANIVRDFSNDKAAVNEVSVNEPLSREEIYKASSGKSDVDLVTEISSSEVSTEGYNVLIAAEPTVDTRSQLIPEIHDSVEETGTTIITKDSEGTTNEISTAEASPDFASKGDIISEVGSAAYKNNDAVEEGTENRDKNVLEESFEILDGTFVPSYSSEVSVGGVTGSSESDVIDTTVHSDSVEVSVNNSVVEIISEADRRHISSDCVEAISLEENVDHSKVENTSEVPMKSDSIGMGSLEERADHSKIEVTSEEIVSDNADATTHGSEKEQGALAAEIITLDSSESQIISKENAEDSESTILESSASVLVSLVEEIVNSGIEITVDTEHIQSDSQEVEMPNDVTSCALGEPITPMLSEKESTDIKPLDDSKNSENARAELGASTIVNFECEVAIPLKEATSVRRSKSLDGVDGGRAKSMDIESKRKKKSTSRSVDDSSLIANMAILHGDSESEVETKQKYIKKQKRKQKKKPYDRTDVKSENEEKSSKSNMDHSKRGRAHHASRKDEKSRHEQTVEVQSKVKAKDQKVVPSDNLPSMVNQEGCRESKIDSTKDKKQVAKKSDVTKKDRSRSRTPKEKWRTREKSEPPAKKERTELPGRASDEVVKAESSSSLEKNLVGAEHCELKDTKSVPLDKREGNKSSKNTKKEKRSGSRHKIDTSEGVDISKSSKREQGVTGNKIENAETSGNFTTETQSGRTKSSKDVDSKAKADSAHKDRTRRSKRTDESKKVERSNSGQKDKDAKPSEHINTNSDSKVDTKELEAPSSAKESSGQKDMSEKASEHNTKIDKKEKMSSKLNSKELEAPSSVKESSGHKDKSEKPSINTKGLEAASSAKESGGQKDKSEIPSDHKSIKIDKEKVNSKLDTNQLKEPSFVKDSSGRKNKSEKSRKIDTKELETPSSAKDSDEQKEKSEKPSDRHNTKIDKKEKVGGKLDTKQLEESSPKESRGRKKSEKPSKLDTKELGAPSSAKESSGQKEKSEKPSDHHSTKIDKKGSGKLDTKELKEPFSVKEVNGRKCKSEKPNKLETKELEATSSSKECSGQKDKAEKPEHSSTKIDKKEKVVGKLDTKQLEERSSARESRRKDKSEQPSKLDTKELEAPSSAKESSRQKDKFEKPDHNSIKIDEKEKVVSKLETNELEASSGAKESVEQKDNSEKPSDNSTKINKKEKGVSKLDNKELEESSATKKSSRQKDKSEKLSDHNTKIDKREQVVGKLDTNEFEASSAAKESSGQKDKSEKRSDNTTKTDKKEKVISKLDTKELEASSTAKESSGKKDKSEKPSNNSSKERVLSKIDTKELEPSSAAKEGSGQNDKSEKPDNSTKEQVASKFDTKELEASSTTKEDSAQKDESEKPSGNSKFDTKELEASFAAKGISGQKDKPEKPSGNSTKIDKKEKVVSQLDTKELEASFAAKESSGQKDKCEKPSDNSTKELEASSAAKESGGQKDESEKPSDNTKIDKKEKVVSKLDPKELGASSAAKEQKDKSEKLSGHSTKIDKKEKVVSKLDTKELESSSAAKESNEQKDKSEKPFDDSIKIDKKEKVVSILNTKELEASSAAKESSGQKDRSEKSSDHGTNIDKREKVISKLDTKELDAYSAAKESIGQKDKFKKPSDSSTKTDKKEVVSKLDTKELEASSAAKESSGQKDKSDKPSDHSSTIDRKDQIVSQLDTKESEASSAAKESSEQKDKSEKPSDHNSTNIHKKEKIYIKLDTKEVEAPSSAKESRSSSKDKERRASKSSSRNDPSSISGNATPEKASGKSGVGSEHFSQHYKLRKDNRTKVEKSRTSKTSRKPDEQMSKSLSVSEVKTRENVEEEFTKEGEPITLTSEKVDLEIPTKKVRFEEKLENIEYTNSSDHNQVKTGDLSPSKKFNDVERTLYIMLGDRIVESAKPATRKRRSSVKEEPSLPVKPKKPKPETTDKTQSSSASKSESSKRKRTAETDKNQSISGYWTTPSKRRRASEGSTTETNKTRSSKSKGASDDDTTKTDNNHGSIASMSEESKRTCLDAIPFATDESLTQFEEEFIKEHPQYMSPHAEIQVTTENPVKIDPAHTETPTDTQNDLLIKPDYLEFFTSSSSASSQSVPEQHYEFSDFFGIAETVVETTPLNPDIFDFAFDNVVTTDSSTFPSSEVQLAFRNSSIGASHTPQFAVSSVPTTVPYQTIPVNTGQGLQDFPDAFPPFNEIVQKGDDHSYADGIETVKNFHKSLQGSPINTAVSQQSSESSPMDSENVEAYTNVAGSNRTVQPSQNAQFNTIYQSNSGNCITVSSVPSTLSQTTSYQTIPLSTAQGLQGNPTGLQQSKEAQITDHTTTMDSMISGTLESDSVLVATTLNMEDPQCSISGSLEPDSVLGETNVLDDTNWPQSLDLLCIQTHNSKHEPVFTDIESLDNIIDDATSGDSESDLSGSFEIANVPPTPPKIEPKQLAPVVKKIIRPPTPPKMLEIPTRSSQRKKMRPPPRKKDTLPVVSNDQSVRVKPLHELMVVPEPTTRDDLRKSPRLHRSQYPAGEVIANLEDMIVEAEDAVPVTENDSAATSNKPSTSKSPLKRGSMEFCLETRKTSRDYKEAVKLSRNQAPKSEPPIDPFDQLRNEPTNPLFETRMKSTMPKRRRDYRRPRSRTSPLGERVYTPVHKSSQSSRFDSDSEDDIRWPPEGNTPKNQNPIHNAKGRSEPYNLKVFEEPFKTHPKTSTDRELRSHPFSERITTGDIPKVQPKRRSDPHTSLNTTPHTSGSKTSSNNGNDDQYAWLKNFPRELQKIGRIDCIRLQGASPGT